ncbi:hypothetical protein FGO68_gene2093 [Halteria grandinella]|uniref:Uncharacterized protein n=1 Tax=Halteria grandinella TaxID=5974 RepID=A0A8J8T204_HALGN|nr:hypothetical protein FGO68_gene2093 [Halteria grandinella]
MNQLGVAYESQGSGTTSCFCSGSSIITPSNSGCFTPDFLALLSLQLSFLKPTFYLLYFQDRLYFCAGPFDVSSCMFVDVVPKNDSKSLEKRMEPFF